MRGGDVVVFCVRSYGKRVWGQRGCRGQRKKGFIASRPDIPLLAVVRPNESLGGSRMAAEREREAIMETLLGGMAQTEARPVR